MSETAVAVHLRLLRQVDTGSAPAGFWGSCKRGVVCRLTKCRGPPTGPEVLEDRLLFLSGREVPADSSYEPHHLEVHSYKIFIPASKLPCLFFRFDASSDEGYLRLLELEYHALGIQSM